MKSKFFIVVIIFLFLGGGILKVKADGLPDADGDGVPDKDEIGVYFTDPNNKDTDGDGFSDFVELNSGYSPHNSKKVTLEKNDVDKDGLNDRMELKFHTNLTNPDTDSDGVKDGDEIKKGSNPTQGEGSVLSKRIEVNLSKQELSYYLGDVSLGTFKVSSGKPSMPTPKGDFIIDGKSPRAWSSYGLWMPYWMSISHGKFGLHELPEWPSGYKEGANHLGKPVSHGCVRLGVGAAKTIYDWAPTGTPVHIF
jgi:lipoprotein-anchoring transpeptidase ErfK/SrfK